MCGAVCTPVRHTSALLIDHFYYHYDDLHKYGRRWVAMDIQPLVTTSGLRNMSALCATQKRQNTITFLIILITALSAVPLLVLSGALTSFTFIYGALASLTIVAVVVWRPVVGLYIALAAVVLIEQAPIPTYIVTDNLYVFYWPPSLEGLFERPIGFLFILTLVVLICSRIVNRKPPLTGGKLMIPFSLYLLCVAIAVGYGLATGGSLKVTVVEARPFWYMFISFLLSYNLITLKKHVRAFFWVVIIGAGVKGLQGTYIYLVYWHGNLQGHDTIMSHEESFFFAALILLLMLFCMHYRFRPQFYVALSFLPPVLIAFFANQRRADYVALVVGLIVAWCMLFVMKPGSRKKMALALLVCVVFLGSYVAAFSHSRECYGQPARAVVSIVNPSTTDTRNTNSNLYRIIENYDLEYTAKRYPLGMGFGKPFLLPVPLTKIFPQIRTFDPYYDSVPHNNIYWIWIRLGVIGYSVFWYLFGAVIVRGCLVARKLKDPYLQLTAIFIVAVAFMEIIVAFADYQLFFFRNVIYVCLLFGMLMRLPAMDETAVAKKEVEHR